jgi:hypothetical protein
MNDSDLICAYEHRTPFEHKIRCQFQNAHVYSLKEAATCLCLGEKQRSAGQGMDTDKDLVPRCYEDGCRRGSCSPLLGEQLATGKGHGSLIGTPGEEQRQSTSLT